MPLRAGKLRHFITILTPTDTVDATGATKQTWSTLINAWAMVLPISAREYVTAGQVFTEMSHKITMRYYSGVTTKCKLQFGTRYFDIKSVSDIEERNEMMCLLCREEMA
jgi:SPP1 family predicted phage head-tail adaptor